MEPKIPTLEGLKEVGRLLLFVMVGGAIAAGLQHLNAIEDPDMTVVILTFVLRYIDKVIHVSERTELNGLAPF